MDINSIISISDKYGKVILKLDKLIDDRGISRNQLARKINVRFEVIDRWYSGRIEKIDLDILARICFVLNCNLGDVIEYDIHAESIKP